LDVVLAAAALWAHTLEDPAEHVVANAKRVVSLYLILDFLAELLTGAVLIVFCLRIAWKVCTECSGTLLGSNSVSCHWACGFAGELLDVPELPKLSQFPLSRALVGTRFALACHHQLQPLLSVIDAESRCTPIKVPILVSPDV